MMEIVKVPVEFIDIEDAPQSKAQQASLMEMDQVAPVYLNKIGGRYKIVDGRRRIVDLIANGATEVFALVDENVISSELAWKALILNASSHNEMDEADHIMKLLGLGQTQSSIAKCIGYSPATVNQRIRLTERLSSVLQSKLRRGEMKYSAAQMATKMPKDLQEKIEDLSPKGVSKALREYQSNAILLFDMPPVDVSIFPPFSVTLNLEQLAELMNGKEIKVYRGSDTFGVRRLG